MNERERMMLWVLFWIGASVIIWGLLIAFGVWASSQ